MWLPLVKAITAVMDITVTSHGRHDVSNHGISIVYFQQLVQVNVSREFEEDNNLQI